MTTIESCQRHVDHLLRTVAGDLDARGVLMIDRAQSLLGAVKRAQLQRREQTTPPDFFNSKWRQQAKALQQCELRLQRIISGADVPQQPCTTRL